MGHSGVVVKFLKYAKFLKIGEKNRNITEVTGSPGVILKRYCTHYRLNLLLFFI